MADIQISHTHESELAAYVAGGNYEKAVEILSRNPEAFSAFIKLTGEGIIKSRNDAQNVKDRNFFQKLFASNSSDLAKVILEQNETMGNFFVLLQLLTLSAKGNVKLLSDLCMSIKKVGKVGNTEQENLNQMAIDFLEHNIESIKEAEIRDKALKKLLKAAEISDQFEMRIAGMVDEIEQKNDSFKNDVSESLGRYEADIAEKMNGIELDIRSFKEDVQNALNELNVSLTKDLAEKSQKIDTIESHISNLVDDLNGKISDIKSVMNSNEVNNTALFAKLSKRVITSTAIAVVAVIGAFLGIVL